MRKSLQTLAALAVVFLFALAHTTKAQNAGGTYTTYIGDKQFGTETYTLTSQADGSQTSVSDVSFAGLRFKATTVFAPDKRPVSYFMEMNGARTLSVEFTPTGGKARIEGQSERELKARAHAILENGVWHQLVFLLAQYDAAQGGAQSFNVLLPGQLIEFVVSVERKGAPSFDVKGRKTSVEQYRLTTNLGLAFDVWTDAERTPLVVSVAAQRLKVVRAGAEDLASVALPAQERRPAASPDDPFTGEEVEFQNGEQKLAGALTIPKTGRAPHPAAIIITGSGPQDRDGSALGSLYKKIAERLSANGVAVLRVDDRGAGASSTPTRPTSYADLVNDTRAALNYLLARKEIDPKRVALIGHSEGALTGLTVAAEDERVAALALLAGASRPVDFVLTEQTLYMTALNDTIDAFDRTKFPEMSRRLAEMFERAKAKPSGAEKDDLEWFREHAAADPLGLIARVRVPLLILNGERDENVLPYHAVALASAAASAGNKQVRLRIFPNLSHVFTPSRLDKSAPPEKLLEVSDEFLQTLKAWAIETLKAVNDERTTTKSGESER